MKRGNYHFRELKSHVYSEQRLTPEFRQFVETEILPHLPFRGYKINAKIEIAFHSVHNLVLAGLVAACVADTRAHSEGGVKLRAEVWDVIVQAGLAKVCLGSQESRKCTRYRATGKLLELRSEWELKLTVDTNLERNTVNSEPTSLALVYVHSGRFDDSTGQLLPEDQQKQPVSIRELVRRHAQPGPDGRPDPTAVENGIKYWTEVEDLIELINRSNLEHAWQAFTTDPETNRKYVFQPNPCIRQVHAGGLWRATRYYSWGQLSGQNLSKEVRKSMLIDSEPSAELDFSGMATRMLYHLNRVNPKGLRRQLLFP